ncbi:MAG TPA: lysophospholipid acyltransferase family protein [Flavipsychrobacter sp.]|nr:lysophospholipid acyltransferase family protein [Flavipsychrobacter sp.]
MKQLKNILGHIYFFYGILLFVATMLVVFIPIWIISFLPDPQKSKALHAIFRVWMGVFMPLALCPVIRRGKKNLKKGQNYVVVINHNSFVDIPVSSPWIPGPTKTLAKVEIAKVPIFGMIYKTGSILLDRKKEGSRRDSFTKMQQMLDMGLHLCLYPEGTRNKTDKPIQPFFDGAFVVAIKAQKPIAPAVIFNTGKILPYNKKLWAWPMPIYFDFLEPVSTEGLTLSDTASLKEKVHSMMENYYVSHLKTKS